MKPETLDLLCNPYKGEPFKLEGDQLIGVSSGEIYPIKNGIPHIIQRSQMSFRDKWYQRFYDLTAFYYDATMRLGENTSINDEGFVRENVISQLKINKSDKVLEVSTGTGLNLSYLSGNAELYGVDISHNMLKRAKNNLNKWNKEAELFLANGAYLPFRDDSFDIVFQMGGLQFFGDTFRGVSEMARVAKPGSTILILDEQSGAMRTLRRMPAHEKYSHDKKTASEAMQRVVPKSMQDVKSEALSYCNYYALSFKKPTH